MGLCCWIVEGEDDLQTTGEMRWGGGWDEDHVDTLEAQEEEARSGNEG